MSESLTGARSIFLGQARQDLQHRLRKIKGLRQPNQGEACMNCIRSQLTSWIGTAVTVLLVPGLFVSIALGQANPPVKSGASSVKLALVTAYAPCTAPDITHNGGPACTPSRLDTICGFGPEGRGSYMIKKIRTAHPSMIANVKLTGLDPACEGLQLCHETSMRTTQGDTHACSGPTGCTLEDPTPSGHCCTVEDGKCTIKGSGIHSNIGGIVEGELLSCRIRRTTGPSLPTSTFACGFYTNVPN
jgi:hypothetical protein